MILCQSFFHIISKFRYLLQVHKLFVSLFFFCDPNTDEGQTNIQICVRDVSKEKNSDLSIYPVDGSLLLLH
jgi:hypothetical protein